MCVCSQRKDQIVLYGSTVGNVGSLVDYSGRQNHTQELFSNNSNFLHRTLAHSQQHRIQLPYQSNERIALLSTVKHSTINVKQNVQCVDYVVPTGYSSIGVPVPSSILQRAMREYKSLSKRVILTCSGNSYIHIQTDERFSWRAIFFFQSEHTHPSMKKMPLMCRYTDPIICSK